jgi:hypothetical protein
MTESVAIPAWLLMRHLVDEDEGTYLAREKELALLRYYANSIAHLLESKPPHPGPSPEGKKGPR